MGASRIAPTTHVGRVQYLIEHAYAHQVRRTPEPAKLLTALLNYSPTACQKWQLVLRLADPLGLTLTPELERQCTHCRHSVNVRNERWLVILTRR